MPTVTGNRQHIHQHYHQSPFPSRISFIKSNDSSNLQNRLSLFIGKYNWNMFQWLWRKLRNVFKVMSPCHIWMGIGVLRHPTRLLLPLAEQWFILAVHSSTAWSSESCFTIELGICRFFHHLSPLGLILTFFNEPEVEHRWSVNCYLIDPTMGQSTATVLTV